jgi:hypothetical protein
MNNAELELKATEQDRAAARDFIDEWREQRRHPRGRDHRIDEVEDFALRHFVAHRLRIQGVLFGSESA